MGEGQRRWGGSEEMERVRKGGRERQRAGDPGRGLRGEKASVRVIIKATLVFLLTFFPLNVHHSLMKGGELLLEFF